MPALQVRDFPQDLYADLKSYAEAHRRSIAQQTVACVERVVRGPQGDGPAVVQAFRPWVDKLRFEDADEQEARKSRHREVMISASKIEWRTPAPTADAIAQMIRDDREERVNGIMNAVEGRPASS